MKKTALAIVIICSFVLLGKFWASLNPVVQMCRAAWYARNVVVATVATQTLRFGTRGPAEVWTVSTLNVDHELKGHIKSPFTVEQFGRSGCSEQECYLTQDNGCCLPMRRPVLLFLSPNSSDASIGNWLVVS